MKITLLKASFLRSIGAIAAQGQIKRVPLTFYLVVHYNIDWRALVNAPQGSKEEIDKAQKFLDEVQVRRPVLIFKKFQMFVSISYLCC